MSSSSSKFAVLAAVVAVLAWAPPRPAGAAAPISFCIDRSSPSATGDRKLAESAASAVGAQARIVTFDGRSGDDNGFGLDEFRKLARSKCNLVMGFPVEPGSETVPAGTRHTRPYWDTGFVLVSSEGLTLNQLPANTRVGVAFNTPANLFLVDRKSVKAIVYDTNTKALDALAKGDVQAVAAWELSVAAYQKHHTQTRVWQEREIRQPHARWQLTALYLPRSAQAAQRFETGLTRLHNAGEKTTENSGGTGKASDGYPRLYTTAQAVRGAEIYQAQCAQCHGAKLQGMVGPSLKGDGFASADDGFTVGGMFGFFSQQMPAGKPGSLKKVEYADLMAFLLQQNGYQPGSHELSYDQAAGSQAPLVAHGGGDGGARNLASDGPKAAQASGN